MLLQIILTKQNGPKSSSSKSHILSASSDNVYNSMPKKSFQMDITSYFREHYVGGGGGEEGTSGHCFTNFVALRNVLLSMLQFNGKTVITVIIISSLKNTVCSSCRNCM